MLDRRDEAGEKCSLFNVQLSFVIDGGASRIFFLEDAAPKAHPKMTSDNRTLNNEHFFPSLTSTGQSGSIAVYDLT